jgi:hypothetical protein
LSELMEVQQNTSVAAVGTAMREAAELRGQIMLARELPRDEEKARAMALLSCARPEFCASEDGKPKAIYVFPRGKETISGPGVKLAREIARLWGNLRYGVQVIPNSDPKKVHIRAQALDLQTNTQVYSEEFSKLHQRKGNTGTAWVEPDERDLRELTARHMAFAERNCLLKIVPPDLIEACVDRCKQTMAMSASGELLKDRKGTVVRIIASFARIGVLPAQLDAFIGGKLDDVTAEQVADLRGALQAIQDGERSAEGIFPSAESDGAAALRARIAELEAKAATAEADPFTPATAEPTPAPTTAEPTAEPSAAEQAEIHRLEMAAAGEPVAEQAQEGTQEAQQQANGGADAQAPAPGTR